jgi:hypothetical protein
MKGKGTEIRRRCENGNRNKNKRVIRGGRNWPKQAEARTEEDRRGCERKERSLQNDKVKSTRKCSCKPESTEGRKSCGMKNSARTTHPDFLP